MRPQRSPKLERAQILKSMFLLQRLSRCFASEKYLMMRITCASEATDSPSTAMVASCAGLIPPTSTPRNFKMLIILCISIGFILHIVFAGWLVMEYKLLSNTKKSAKSRLYNKEEDDRHRRFIVHRRSGERVGFSKKTLDSQPL